MKTVASMEKMNSHNEKITEHELASIAKPEVCREIRLIRSPRRRLSPADCAVMERLSHPTVEEAGSAESSLRPIEHTGRSSSNSKSGKRGARTPRHYSIGLGTSLHLLDCGRAVPSLGTPLSDWCYGLTASGYLPSHLIRVPVPNAAAPRRKSALP
jgi:hypothetical protein